MSQYEIDKKETEDPTTKNEKVVAQLAKKLDAKMNLLQDYLKNVTDKLSTSCFHTTKNLSKDKKLPQPCCSNQPDFDQNQGIIDLNFSLFYTSSI